MSSVRIQFKVFERAVMKLQWGDNFSQQEATVFKMFKIPVGSAIAAADTAISNSIPPKNSSNARCSETAKSCSAV